MSDKEKHKERKERAQKISKALKEAYPGKIKTVLEYSNPLEMLVAVILSAQCTDERVNMVTKDLFQKYKTAEDYANADLEEFQKDIYSTGFYKNKAKNIIGMAKALVEKYGGVVPRTMEEMRELPGVGRKTANVVLGNAYDVVEGIAVDTHVRRFAQKFDLTDSKNPDIIERDLMGLLPRDEWFDLTYRFITYGREVCTAREHDCEEHFLTKIYPEAANRWPKSK